MRRFDSVDSSKVREVRRTNVIQALHGAMTGDHLSNVRSESICCVDLTDVS